MQGSPITNLLVLAHLKVSISTEQHYARVLVCVCVCVYVCVCVCVCVCMCVLLRCGESFWCFPSMFNSMFACLSSERLSA